MRFENQNKNIFFQQEITFCHQRCHGWSLRTSCKINGLKSIKMLQSSCYLFLLATSWANSLHLFCKKAIKWNSHPRDIWGPRGGLLRLYIASYDDLMAPIPLRMGGRLGIGGMGSRRSGGDTKSPRAPRDPPISSPREAPTGYRRSNSSRGESNLARS